MLERLHHPILLFRAEPDQRTPAERASTLPACWAAYLAAAHEELFTALRLEPLGDKAFGLRASTNSSQKHAEVLTIAEVDGLRVREGGDLPRFEGRLSMAGGGAMSAWPRAKQLLARKLGDLLCCCVPVYDTVDGASARVNVACEALRLVEASVASLPSEVLDFPVRWTEAGKTPLVRPLAQHGARTTRAARVAALLS